MTLLNQSLSIPMNEFMDIPSYNTFLNIRPVEKGWSSDKKYYIETSDNKSLLLRIADIAEYESKKAEFEHIKQIDVLNIPMSHPIDFGICNNGKNVYTLLTWCDGKDAESVLPMLTETQQYALGIKTGEILRKIHSIPAPDHQEDWSSRFNRKMDTKIQKYKDCPLSFPGDDKMIEYLEANRHLLANRPQSCQHGDFHTGNMIISDDGGTISIIDFNRPDFGDPWEEFNRIVWSASISPYFATGQLNGYFNGRPPIEFFKLLALYTGSNTLSSIYWSIPFGQGEIDIMMKQSQDVLSWFHQMETVVPAWYLEDFYIQYTDEIPYKLKTPFDFSFLRKYGRVFKVYDDQDSGNICFGVKNGENRYFIKFAGAPTTQYNGSPKDAIQRLKSITTIYKDLAHPNLIKFVKEEEIGEGYAVVFQWVDGECMGRMYPLSRQKFMEMPLETKMEVFKDILDFHAHAVQKGYVAIDFYDGSIMYDFTNQKTILCDIDFYTKEPVVNTMGKMWGSSRFMSPEEFTLGASIDKITNVYLMGATAFALFADSSTLMEHWSLNKDSYKVALKATSKNPSDRYPNIKTFIKEWERAHKQI